MTILSETIEVSVQFAFGADPATDPATWGWTEVAGTGLPPALYVAGNGQASTPDRTSFNLSTGFTAILYGVRLDDWSPAGNGSFLIGQETTVANGAFGWDIRRTATSLQFRAGNGTGTFTTRSRTWTTPVDGETWDIGCTYTSAGMLQFSVRRTGEATWTALTSSTATFIWSNSTATLRVGNNVDGTVPLNGSIKRAEIVTPGLVQVASPDFAGQPPGVSSFVDDQGNLWSLNGNASIPPTRGAVIDQTIMISRGRPDEGSGLQPSTVSFELDNSSGWFTPDNPRSPYYPNLRRGTPVRVRVRWNGVWQTRFAGQVDEWQVDFPDGGAVTSPVAPLGESRTVVKASAFLRRVQQGTKALGSPIRRGVMSDECPADVVAYWPMEDESGATVAASPIEGVSPIALVGYTFAADSGLFSSKPLPRAENGASTGFNAPVPYAPNGPWLVEMALRLNRPPNPDNPPAAYAYNILEILTVGSDIKRWLFRLFITYSGSNPLWSFHLYGYDIDDNIQISAVYPAAEAADLASGWAFAQIQVFDFATTFLTARLMMFTPAGPAPSFPSGTTWSGHPGPGRVTRIRSLFNAPSTGISIGHLAVATDPGPGVTLDWGTLMPVGAIAADGWKGETAQARIERILAESDYQYVETHADASQPMGVQPVATLFDILSECVTADDGVMYDVAEDFALTYRPRKSLYNALPSITLDAGPGDAGGLVAPFVPVFDDQRLANDVTAQRTNGSSVRVTDEDSIAHDGLYDSTFPVNLEADTDLRGWAGWKLHRGTWRGMRYPVVSVNLANETTNVDTWLTLNPGDVIAIENLSNQHPEENVRLLVEGYEENIGSVDWDMRFNCSPGELWDVGVLNDDTSCRLSSDDSTLTSTITTGATTFSVTVPGPKWTTTPAHFPFDIVIGGERMTVTAISGAGSPQTFTVERAKNDVQKAHIAGSPVALAVPTILAW